MKKGGKRKQSKGKKQGSKTGAQAASINKLAGGGLEIIYKTPGMVIPDQTRCRLVYYPGATTYFVNTGGIYGNIRYRINSPYDVDPTLGSTAITGFVEMTYLYTTYRCLSASYNVRFFNENDHALDIYLCPLAAQEDPGANNTAGFDYQMAPYARWSGISAKGGLDAKTLKGSIDFAKLVSGEVVTDDAYAAPVSGNPTNQIWLIVGGQMLTGDYMTDKVACDVHITMDVVFYKRRDITT